MISLVFTCLLGFHSPAPAYGWGQYGHELVQVNAMQLLVAQKHPLTKFFTANALLMKSLATAPDTDWQGKKITKNQKEHSLHFFAADAFAKIAADPEAILKLPAGEFSTVSSKLEEMALANRDYLREYSASGRPVAEYGTAPWRILQLYDLSVTALRSKDFKKAALYLGALGNYVAEMSEPFRTTMNFNGEYYPVAASGIFEIFENSIIERAIDEKDSDFQSASAAAAASEASIKGMDGLTRDRVIPEIYKLIHTGFAYLDPLLRAFSDQCMKAEAEAQTRTLAAKTENQKKTQPYCEGGDDKPPAGLVKSFSEAALHDEKDADLKVLGFAQRRMASGSLLLARIWAAAYAEAGSPAVEGTALKSAEIGVIQNYPQPTYLPGTASR